MGARGLGELTNTRTAAAIGFALLWSGSWGCADDDSSRSQPSRASDAGPPPVRALYQPSAPPMRFGDIPWPDDAYLDVDGRISVRDIPTQAPSDYAAALATAMSDLDGFGIRPTIYFRFDGQLDPDSLPGTSEDSAKAASSVFLIDADTGSPTAYQRVAVDVHYDADAMELRLRPAQSRALTPGRRYAAVVTRDVVAMDGRAIEPSLAFLDVRDAGAKPRDPSRRAAREIDAPVLATLENAGIARERVVALAVFHVQTVRDDLLSARALVHTSLPSAAMLKPSYSATDLDAIFGATQGPGLDDAGPHDHIGWMVHGEFASPNLLSPRNGVHGAFRRSASGELRTGSPNDMHFTLWLPRGAMPPAPLPVVIVAHGLGRERSDALPLANALAGFGYATIAMDAPFHGASAGSEDAVNRFTGAMTPDGFADQPGDFIGANDERGDLYPLHPFYYRDAVRQGVVDLMGLLALLQNGDWSALGGLDSSLATVQLDTLRPPFVGIDLGADLGTMLAAFEPSLGPLVLVGGSGLSVDAWIDSPAAAASVDALLRRLGHAPQAIDFSAEQPLEWPDVDAWRTLSDRACALAYAPMLDRVPSNVLLLMARDDEVVHNRSTEALARGLGAEIAGGKPSFALDLSERTLRPGASLSANFAIGSGAVTRVLYALEPATHDVLVRVRDAQNYRAPLMRPFSKRSRAVSVTNPLAQTANQIAFFFESFRTCNPTTPLAMCPAYVQAPPTYP